MLCVLHLQLKDFDISLAAVVGEQCCPKNLLFFSGLPMLLEGLKELDGGPAGTGLSG